MDKNCKSLNPTFKHFRSGPKRKMKKRKINFHIVYYLRVVILELLFVYGLFGLVLILLTME